MEFKIEKFENHTLIKVLAEKLETEIASSLKPELVIISGRGEKNIILDLNDCKYCDSNGLSAILVARRLCTNSSGTLVLTGIRGQVERLIRESHLDSLIKITNSVKDAVSVFKSDK